MIDVFTRGGGPVWNSGDEKECREEVGERIDKSGSDRYWFRMFVGPAPGLLLDFGRGAVAWQTDYPTDVSVACMKGSKVAEVGA